MARFPRLPAHDTGDTVILLCLAGTIPVSFRGNTYNIPIAAWLPHDYPLQPAMCYVVPTPQMLIRPSKHVDLSGKIYHPYLAYWRDRPDESTLLDFLGVLQGIFGNEPPVYTKPAGAPAAKPRSPNPMTGGPPFGPTSGTPPPYAPGSGFGGQPAFNPMMASSQLQPVGPAASMPVIERSPELGSAERQSALHGVAGHSRSHSASFPPGSSPGAGTSPGSGTTGSAMLANSVAAAASAAAAANATTTPDGRSPSPLPTDASLLSSLSLHPTPVQLRAPLNPIPADPRLALKDRARRAFAEYSANATHNMDLALTVNKRLNESERRVNDALRKLTDEIRRAEQNKDIFERTAESLEGSLAPLRSGDQVLDPDKAAMAPTPVFNQLLELAADDAAIEDAIYHLSRALQSERIDLQAFLKHVRTLAREQFLRRALMKKCREVAGLRPG